VISTVPATVENFLAFAGFSVTSVNTYTFNDTISISKTLTTDSSDFCGAKTFEFTLNSQPSAYLAGDNFGKIVFSPPSSASPIFKNAAQLTAKMENYPTVKSIPL
jgi:hypothetical protein